MPPDTLPEALTRRLLRCRCVQFRLEQTDAFKRGISLENVPDRGCLAVVDD